MSLPVSRTSLLKLALTLAELATQVSFGGSRQTAAPGINFTPPAAEPSLAFTHSRQMHAAGDKEDSDFFKIETCHKNFIAFRSERVGLTDAEQWLEYRVSRGTAVDFYQMS